MHVQGQYKNLLGRPNSDDKYIRNTTRFLFVKYYLPLILPVPQICFMIAKFTLLVLVVIQHSSFIL